jgi:putative ABC transport system ATP-binding protein
LKLLDRLNDEFGKTIVMVTHDPNAAAAAKKVHHLDKGRLAAKEFIAPGRDGYEAPIPLAAVAEAPKPA